MLENRESTMENRRSQASIIHLLSSIFYVLYVLLSAIMLQASNAQVAWAGAAIQASSNVPAPGAGQKKVVLKKLGMSCPFCKAAVSAKLKQVSGVIAYDVELKSDSATVLYDPAKVTIEKLKHAIAEAGFQVRAVQEVGQ